MQFADDTCLICYNDDHTQVKDFLSSDLDSLIRWIATSDDDDGTTSTKRELQLIEKPSENKITNIYGKLLETSGKPVISSLVTAYSNWYVTACQLHDYPSPLTELFDPALKL